MRLPGSSRPYRGHPPIPTRLLDSYGQLYGRFSTCSIYCRDIATWARAASLAGLPIPSWRINVVAQIIERVDLSRGQNLPRTVVIGIEVHRNRVMPDIRVPRRIFEAAAAASPGRRFGRQRYRYGIRFGIRIMQRVGRIEAGTGSSGHPRTDSHDRHRQCLAPCITVDELNQLFLPPARCNPAFILDFEIQIVPIAEAID